MSNYCSLDLDDLRAEPGSVVQPFPHQKEAFQALDKVYSFKDKSPKAGLLVLPTGAGKTFTAVNWVCRKAIPRGMKVLWLAQSFHLLDQARESFEANARYIPPPNRFLNLRVVSSHPSHEKVNAVETTDDVVIVTTQTAISALTRESLDVVGSPFVSKLEAFVLSTEQTGLVVILDEAHHAPAYGCRQLLTKLREVVPHMALLGLTATPSYTDESKRGWLGKIFTNGVVHQAKQSTLMAQNILAKPVFVEMPTGFELEVDNSLYHRLVQEHKDLPDDLVERLARDSARNDYIIDHYVAKRAEYGKTIIFTDRWFQCIYIKEKLKAKGIRAEAVFSHVDGKAAEDGRRPSTTSAENAEAIRRFKANEFDVLVNVRMLTEGTDVPDTRTIFITRQTTSSILLTQMVGRALRGKKAGGGSDKEQANIVLFVDKWKHLLDIWATPQTEGGTEDSNSVRGHRPMEYIAINLVEALARRIDNPGAEIDDLSYVEHIPVGWYTTEYSVAVVDGNEESTEPVREFVMVFAGTEDKYRRFIDGVFSGLPQEWGKENLPEAWTEPQVQQWVEQYFGEASDDLGKARARNLTSLARHMGAKGTRPEFVPFDERDLFDLDQLAADLYDRPSPSQLETLRAAFDRDGNLWRVFYKSNFEWFKMDFDAAIYRLWRKRTQGPVEYSKERRKETNPGRAVLDEKQWERLRVQVMARDNSTCQACGAKGTGVKLQLDHIISRDHGGPDTVENLQMLCSICNGPRYKGVNDINFRSHATPLKAPKAPFFLSRNGSEEEERALRRLVNFFYHCGAVCKISINQRRNGTHYSTWEIELYKPNDPKWLAEHKEALIEHINKDFGCDHVTDIVVS